MFGFLFLIRSLGVFGVPRRADLTNCAPWHTSSFWDRRNEGRENTWASCLNPLLCTVPSQHLFVCLLPSVSISPLCIILLSLPFLELIIFCPLLPLAKKNDIYSSSPRCRVSSIHTSVFQLVPHWCTEEIRPKKKKSICGQQLRTEGEQLPWPARLWWVDQRPPPKPEQEEMLPAISNNDRHRQIVRPFWGLLHGNRTGNVSERWLLAATASDSCLFSVKGRTKVGEWITSASLSDDIAFRGQSVLLSSNKILHLKKSINSTCLFLSLN